MFARPRSSTRDALSLQSLSRDHEANEPPLLPTFNLPPASPEQARVRLTSLSSIASYLRPTRARTRSRLLYVLFFLIGLIIFNQTRIGTWRRDFVYLIRPIWDTPPKPFHVIPHYAPPLARSGAEDIDAWCGLHNFTSRGGAKPTIVDAVLLSSEVDMLEIRIREYKGIVNTFVVVESDRTFAGTEKRLYFEENRRKLEGLLVGSGSRIVYHKVEGLLPGRQKGSFENEFTMRTAVSSTLTSLRLSPGSLILNSDVDEIISRDTLQLLASCNVPNNLHLNVKNYRYSWAWPIPDAGYWRPHVSISDGGPVGYSHGRVGDVLLEGAGWHCTFCFATIAEMRDKMLGYSHNDRVRNGRIARLDRIRSKVCRGQEAFEMYPVSLAIPFRCLPADLCGDVWSVGTALTDRKRSPSRILSLRPIR